MIIYSSFTQANKLTAARNKVLEELLKESNPWIENSASLSDIIQELTMEHQPQKVIDLERLFHSCRLEPEVTNETVRLLKVVAFICVEKLLIALIPMIGCVVQLPFGASETKNIDRC